MKRQQGKEPFWKQIVRYRQHYIMLIPFFLIFIVFTVWPVIMSVILSFTNYLTLSRNAYSYQSFYRHILFRSF